MQDNSCIVYRREQISLEFELVRKMSLKQVGMRARIWQWTIKGRVFLLFFLVVVKCAEWMSREVEVVFAPWGTALESCSPDQLLLAFFCLVSGYRSLWAGFQECLLHCFQYCELSCRAVLPVLQLRHYWMFSFLFKYRLLCVCGEHIR